MAVVKNHRAIQWGLCDSWIHITCNNINVYKYQKVQKEISLVLYCVDCFWMELSYGFTNDTIIVWGDFCFHKSKNISSIIKQNEYLDEEL